MCQKEWSMRLFARALIAAHAAVLALGLTSSPVARGADTDSASEKPTVMTVRGKVLFRDALGQPLVERLGDGQGQVGGRRRSDPRDGSCRPTSTRPPAASR